MAKEVLPSGVVLYDPLDYKSRREAIFEGVKGAFEKSFPRVVNGVRMELHNLAYKGAEDIAPGKEKDTLMSGGRLSAKLKGTVRLYEDATNTLLDEKPDYTVANVPYFTDSGTFIDGSNDYTVASQARLIPGVYSRFKANGDLDAHFNTRRGGGPSFHIAMDPTTATYKLEIMGRTAPLYPVMKAFGISDEQMEKAWGTEVFLANRKDDPKVVPKLYSKVIGRKARVDASYDEMAAELKAALESGMVNEAITRRNLPNAFSAKVAHAWSVAQMDQKLASAAKVDGFEPDYSPAELRKMIPGLGSIGGDSWIDWYMTPRHKQDQDVREKMERRWVDSTRKQIGNFVMQPTVERAVSLIRWGVNPFKHVPVEKAKTLLHDLSEHTKEGFPGLDEDGDIANEHCVHKGKGGQDLRDRVALKRAAEAMFLHDEGHLNSNDEDLLDYTEKKLASVTVRSNPVETSMLLAFTESIINHVQPSS